VGECLRGERLEEEEQRRLLQPYWSDQEYTTVLRLSLQSLLLKLSTVEKELELQLDEALPPFGLLTLTS
jgi:hypothetical protein